MALPRKLKHFNVFHNGVSWLGQVGEVTVPKIAIKAEEWRGAGMIAPVDIDLGLEKMELELTCGGLMLEAMADLGLVNVDGVLIRFMGSFQEESLGNVDAVDITCRGKLIEYDPGSAKAGDDTEHKIKYTLSYYKIMKNGGTLVEIDVQNQIYLINGVDRMAAHRRAMGL